MSSGYAWDYLKHAEPRATELWKIIAEYMRQCSVVLDINCGFAPLKSKFIPFVQHYAGNDVSLEAIETCTKGVSDKDRDKTTFVWASDQMIADHAREVFPELNFDAFIFLGITSGNRPWESMTEHIAVPKLISEYLPKFVVLETATTVPKIHMQPIVNHLRANGYMVARASNYSFPAPKNGDREVWVFEHLSDLQRQVFGGGA